VLAEKLLQLYWTFETGNYRKKKKAKLPMSDPVVNTAAIPVSMDTTNDDAIHQLLSAFFLHVVVNRYALIIFLILPTCPCVQWILDLSFGSANIIARRLI
jgi:hypothetical protein